MDGFKDLRIVDNFYQTSAFFPMPTVLAGTLSENGMTNIGSYSLCFPYYIAGKDYYAMLLECRNSSNTAQNLLRTGKVSLNFIPDKRKYLLCSACGDDIDHLADVLHRRYLFHGKFHPERTLDRADERDMLEAVPIVNIVRSGLTRYHDGIVVKHASEHRCKPRYHHGFIHHFRSLSFRRSRL